MKTLKRIYPCPDKEDFMDARQECVDWYRLVEARWKRKNRVKQLKRTIQRYKYGTMLDDQFDLYLAYKWLQQLKMPSKKADSRSWKCYIYGLRAIRGVIVSALMESEQVLKKALERENGKEPR